MDGRARERRAREPKVDEAVRRSEADETRVKVRRRRGREPEDGEPRRESNWLENVSIAGRRSVLR